MERKGPHGFNNNNNKQSKKCSIHLYLELVSFTLTPKLNPVVVTGFNLLRTSEVWSMYTLIPYGVANMVVTCCQHIKGSWWELKARWLKPNTGQSWVKQTQSENNFRLCPTFTFRQNNDPEQTSRVSEWLRLKSNENFWKEMKTDSCMLAPHSIWQRWAILKRWMSKKKTT